MVKSYLPMMSPSMENSVDSGGQSVAGSPMYKPVLAVRRTIKDGV